MATKLKSGKYRAHWTDENGLRKSKAGFTTKSSANDFADEERLTVKKVLAGHIERDKIKYCTQALLPFAKHLDDYQQWKVNENGNETKHIKATMAIISGMETACSWDRISDIEPLRLRTMLATYSAATHNAHLSAIRGFTKWLVQHKRLRADPLTMLRRRNTDKDRTFTRVPMTPEMVEKVLAASDENGRYYLYQLLSVTGLRIGEALRLRPKDFDFDGGNPTVTVFGKSQKIEKQPLPTVETLWEMKTWLLTIPDKTTTAWPITRCVASKYFQADLKRAGIPAQRGLDLHSFRHGYITELSKQVCPGGITIEDLRILARHSDISTTAKYLHGTCDGNRGKAVDKAFGG